MKLAIIKNPRYYYLFSMIIIMLAIARLIFRGLNLGIDFSSGPVI